MSNTTQSLAKRFWIYQSERFPFLTHSPLLAAFTFSAISFSLVCRGEIGFIDIKIFLVGLATTISLFFLLRISDEFKDKKIDAQFRPELPVPRGLVTLRELGMIGFGVIVLILILNTWLTPQMLLLLIPSLLFLWASPFYDYSIHKGDN
jgi:4-hydroxybenzoate polyprenyltransferase